VEKKSENPNIEKSRSGAKNSENPKIEKPSGSPPYLGVFNWETPRHLDEVKESGTLTGLSQSGVNQVPPDLNFLLFFDLGVLMVIKRSS
jgi:hypothetical protein